MNQTPPPVPLSELFHAVVARELSEQLTAAKLNLDKMPAATVLDFAERLGTCRMSHGVAMSIRLAFTADTSNAAEIIRRTAAAAVRDAINDFKKSQHAQIFSQPAEQAPAQ